ncbi:MAG TPA: hypothetical protein VD948_00605 [Rhodothermales bacterium]|nr:hypothetical protein [Rhodothermales bacterium]
MTPATSSLNPLPVAAMSAGWLAPLLMFWLSVWGPLRPFDYPGGNLLPSPVAVAASLVMCAALWVVPSPYYRIRRFEQNGRIYERLGVRLFRHLVPDGDLANRWHRRQEPGFRVISSRRDALLLAQRTRQSERSHLVFLAVGFLSALYAVEIGWSGWAWYLGAGNVLVNLYPVMLQRYTRARVYRLGVTNADMQTLTRQSREDRAGQA